MAKRRKKSKKTIVLNRYKLSAILIGIGAIFFFVKSVALNSPLFDILSIPSYFLFGKIGANLFFGLLIAMGLLMFWNLKIVSNFKKIFFLFFLVLCIINFPILESSSISPEKLGGWIGFIGIWGGSMMLGSSIIAVKSFFLLLTLIVLFWIMFSLNLKISAPKLEIDLPKPDKEPKAIKEKNTKPEKSLMKSLFDAATASASSEDKDKANLKALLKDKINQKIFDKEFEKQNTQIKINFPKDKPTFDINLLKPSAKPKDENLEETFLLNKAKAIQDKLEEFDINVEIEGFNIGPTVVQIKIKPDAGVKISKIENYQKDLALAAKTKSLRILTPIPGTDNVGIEIPNPNPELVRIREILGSNVFNAEMANNFTNLVIGKSIDGKMIVKSLESMPHLLVAGATGAGKSVGINDFITSLIYQNTPSELRFIMIDPKQVELGIYEGIPYLLSPIISHPDKSVKVLKRAVNHMEERYYKLKQQKVRNIDEYNDKVADEEKMYRIVIIIDELADLMMSGRKKDTEEAITRIAQKARAVGIHLILATQRPSVNVITGLIKANMPTRIAFSVISQIDSRTIIDMKGAEDLIGYGDMLYIDPKTKFPVRIQSPLLETDETEKIVNHIKNVYMKGIDESQIYHPEIINILESKGENVGTGGAGEGGNDEELVQQAIEIIQQTNKASATLLQRKLGIGFARAARIMDMLEERGIVGPQEGAKPREILI